MKCAICGKHALPRPENPSGPFCSPRCKQIDLGKWFSGDYRVPVAPGLDEGAGDDLEPQRREADDDDARIAREGG